MSELIGEPETTVGWIDSPMPSQKVQPGRVEVIGWAMLGDQPPPEILVMINGHVVGKGSPSLHRPDVIEALGLEASVPCGFAVSIDLSTTSGIQQGPLELLVGVPDDRSKNPAPFASVTLELSEPSVLPQIRGFIDLPLPGSTVNPRNVLIKGWALIDGHPATSVVITADDLTVGIARVDQSRPDLVSAFGDSFVELCGFAATVDLSEMAVDQVRLAVTTFVSTGAEGALHALTIGDLTVHLLDESSIIPPEVDEHLLREIASEWWYYSVELLPGLIAKGIDHPWDIPMLPRILMRSCDLADMDCLDLGSMEGLIPVLMRRQRARSVLATDYDERLRTKIKAVQHAYGVWFEYQEVGLMYDLYRTLEGRGFDFINCSGLLYHTWSPLHVLAGVRPLLRRNGLMIISTVVNLDDESYMEFNRAGHLNPECNTFWYLSVGVFGYMLRYLRLQPIEVLYTINDEHWRTPGYPLPEVQRAYISVLCRAVDTADIDGWMDWSARHSIEFRHNTDWSMADSQRMSRIATGRGTTRHLRSDPVRGSPVLDACA